MAFNAVEEGRTRVAREDAMQIYGQNPLPLFNLSLTLSTVALSILLVLAFSVGSHAEHAGITRNFEFNVTYLNISRLCHSKQVVSINGQLPGPTIHVNEGDRVIIKVTNFVDSNVSIHWHGVRQFRSGWADGPAYVTQCPIQSGDSYTYNFTVLSQSGTLWWHAHITWTRATVHGALIIHPKRGVTYPFQQPDDEVPLVLGEWWNAKVEDVFTEFTAVGGLPNISDAYTINGQPGPLYKCSTKDAFVMDVTPGKTYLLRIINAGLNNELFFSVANHTLLVVETDALYTKPFSTKTIFITPGQTMSVLLQANQSIGKYYIAARPYASAVNASFDNTTTTAILNYQGSSDSAQPILPELPEFNDTAFADHFDSSLRSLPTTDYPVNVPQTVDRSLFFTVGLAVKPCPLNHTCVGPNGNSLAAAVNNVSFVLPHVALLQAHYFNIQGVFTTDLPDQPAQLLDFTGKPPKNLEAAEGTKLTVIPYGVNVQLVLQDTSTLATENHPIHLHGYNFFVVGRGFGNFHPANSSSFNLVDPPQRNTLGVPAGGWAALRFKADNPGVWFMHCHLEIHNTWGLEMAFIVQDGNRPDQKMLPPPNDLPRCV
ncbi:hypothetical protein O6H91_22G011700 [Diphasiastrum complanatum]|uniref:Uncharacterized protein n=1 Tax=Diphasiastrum complanatum TaxID=34168 RepID=A0ACC2ACX5_DIPCM|nr:hypothetical protein O6H91_22G011700 [Diphasiastrum complanatum]